MAFSYEEKQGPEHRPLAEVLRDTSYYVNGSTVVLRRMVRKNGH